MADHEQVQVQHAIHSHAPSVVCRGSDMEGMPAMQPVWRVQLCLWCMSPAVAFAGLQQAASSIVLTSGTLSPLEGIAYEV